MNFVARSAIIIALLIIASTGTLHSQTEGEKVGEVKQIDTKTSEVYVGSPSAGIDIQMGDLLYVRIEGKAVQLRATFPMQTIAKCKAEGKNRALLKKAEKGMSVYRFKKGVEDFRSIVDIQSKIYKIGDRGPAGGWVFYDKGSYEDGWRYLEAAPEDQSNNIPWYNGKSIETGATGLEVGTGKSNTRKIIKVQGKGNYAAKLCADYRGGNKSDWFMPSQMELDLVYINLHKRSIGRFTNKIYWSSSENNADFVRLQGFDNGMQYGINKNSGRRGNGSCVRAIRAF